MPAARIALVTCAALPALDADDRVLADALSALGCEVVPAVWDDPAVAWRAFDLALLRSPWDYHLRRDAFVCWAARAARATTLLNPPEVVAWNTSKTYLRALADTGVPTVPTAWLPAREPADLCALLAARGWAEAVVKPVVGLGSSGLARVPAGDAGGAGQAALARLLADGEAMVQPFVPSVAAEGELSLVFIAGELSHVVRKRPRAGEFRVQPEFGASAEPATPSAAQRAVADAALSTLAEPPLYARVDLVAGEDGAPWLMELELVEPTLYLATAGGAAQRLAQRVLAAARTPSGGAHVPSAPAAAGADGAQAL